VLYHNKLCITPCFKATFVTYLATDAEHVPNVVNVDMWL